MRRVAALLCTVCFCAGCSEPPQKEIDHAQGALAAARAAGADLYAGVELAAASSALKQSHEAVGQRDYRLALSRALDASQRAQDAARQAADGKARARSEAEAAILATERALQDLEARITGVLPTRSAEADLRPAQQTMSDGQRMLQKARAALAAGAYLEAGAAVATTTETIQAQTRALDEATRGKVQRRRR